MLPRKHWNSRSWLFWERVNRLFDIYSSFLSFILHYPWFYGIPNVGLKLGTNFCQIWWYWAQHPFFLLLNLPQTHLKPPSPKPMTLRYQKGLSGSCSKTVRLYNNDVKHPANAITENSSGGLSRELGCTSRQLPAESTITPRGAGRGRGWAWSLLQFATDPAANCNQLQQICPQRSESKY